MTIALYILALVVANTIQGITGFAGNVIAMPPSAILLGVDTARGALNIMSLFSGAFMTIWFRKDIEWRKLATMILFIMPGIVAGMAAYSLFPADQLLIPYGVVVAAIGIWYLRGRRNTPIPRPLMGAIVFAAGLMQGMFVSGGPLMIVYAVTVLHDKEKFRATLSALWLVLNLIIFIQSFFAGRISYEAGQYALIGIGPIILATIAGGLLQKHINQDAFMKLTYVLLVLSGCMLVANALA